MFDGAMNRKSVASGNVIQEKISNLDKISSHKFGGLGRFLAVFLEDLWEYF